MNQNKKTKIKHVVYPQEWLYLLIITILVFFAPKLIVKTFNVILPASFNMNKIVEVTVQDENAKIKSFMIEDKLMLQSGENLGCYNKDGKQEWSRTLKSLNTKILKWNDFYIIADLDSGRIAKIDKDNELIKEVSGKGKMKDIIVSKNYLYALLDSSNEVLYLNSELEEERKISNESGDIMKIACDLESSEVLMYTVSIENGEFKTFCVIYDEEGKITASLDLNQAIIFDIFMDDNIVMVSDEKILVFNKNAKPISDYEYVGNLSDSDFKNQKIYAICTNSESNFGEKELRVYDDDLNFLNKIKLSDNSSKISVGDKYILLASEKRISIINSDLETLNEINLNTDVEEIKWISKNAFYIVGNGKLSIYSNK